MFLVCVVPRHAVLLECWKLIQILNNDLAINSVVKVTFSMYHITVQINHVLYMCTLLFCVVLFSQHWGCGKEARGGVIRWGLGL